MAEYVYKMEPISEENWTKKEKDFINSKSDIISETVNQIVKERHKNGVPLAFCKEAVRRFDYSMRAKNNDETKAWLRNFTGNEEEDKLNIKRFFDKKLINTMDYVDKHKNKVAEIKNKGLREAIKKNRKKIETLKYQSILWSEDASLKTFIQYREAQKKKHFESTGRKLDEQIANEKAMEEMYRFIDQTKTAMSKFSNKNEVKETPYNFYMGADTERVLTAVKNTREKMSAQGFDNELITNTENHMRSVLSEEKYNIHKNFYSSYEVEEGIELAMYKDMSDTINKCYTGKTDELKEYTANNENVKKFPTYQDQLLINIKKITEEPVAEQEIQNTKEKSMFTQFENMASFEEQTTYRMKLLREKDRIDQIRFGFYPQDNVTKEMADAALRIEKCLGDWQNGTELTKTALPKMPAVHDYDDIKVMFVSKESWDSFMQQSGGDCYATIETFQICDMNKIVIVDNDCNTQVYEPHIESIEGKKYWKGFTEDKTLTKAMESTKEVALLQQQDVQATHEQTVAQETMISIEEYYNNLAEDAIQNEAEVFGQFSNIDVSNFEDGTVTLEPELG